MRLCHLVGDHANHDLPIRPETADPPRRQKWLKQPSFWLLFDSTAECNCNMMPATPPTGDSTSSNNKLGIFRQDTFRQSPSPQLSMQNPKRITSTGAPAWTRHKSEPFPPEPPSQKKSLNNVCIMMNEILPVDQWAMRWRMLSSLLTLTVFIQVSHKPNRTYKILCATSCHHARKTDRYMNNNPFAKDTLEEQWPETKINHTTPLHKWQTNRDGSGCKQGNTLSPKI